MIVILCVSSFILWYFANSYIFLLFAVAYPQVGNSRKLMKHGFSNSFCQRFRQNTFCSSQICFLY